MENMRKIALLMAMLAGLAIAGAANAQTVISADIAVDTDLFAADNPFQLDGPIYVLPGATLTIHEGVIFKNVVGDLGALVVTRGADIHVEGTVDNPVIMTSEADDLHQWHEGADEWGNLTIMGNGVIGGYARNGSTPLLISEDLNNDGDINDAGEANVANTAVPQALNRRTMEGLVAGYTGDPRVLYGGGDDDDDSGSIQYLSIRYGGHVQDPQVELNGLSLGGVGRGTDIEYVEIMNNLDDGIEIWGGTVNLKHISIWNIGDDSFDIDQGWRGNAQYLFIVQGYSLDTGQGGGVGDNCIECDGCENSDGQPVTRACIYNATVVGQPDDGDYGIALRDSAGLQVRRSIFMNCGDDVVQFDNDDTDGAQGYSGNAAVDDPTVVNPTTGLSFDDYWTTAAGTLPAYNASATAPFRPIDLYTGTQQTNNSGTLCEVRDTVFFDNVDYGEATRVAVNVITAPPAVGAQPRNNEIVGTSPIASLIRADLVVKGGKDMRSVVSINPTPVGAATSVADAGPTGAFFDDVSYRGAFSPNCSENWLRGWSAADAYGFLATQAGDVTGDCAVNMDDFGEVSGNWLAN